MLLNKKYIRIEPAAAAIIMAYGICFIGVIEYFPTIDNKIGMIGALSLIALWLIIYTLLSWQFFQADFFRKYMPHPVQTFTIGTWIAGVSVLCNVLLKYFPNQTGIIYTIGIFNSLLWIAFCIICIRNFITLSKMNIRIDGAILLSTVGIQSVVILLHEITGGIPPIIAIFAISIGILFYITSITLISRSYTQNKWNMADHWANTNCIIHGALSITGLAIVTANIPAPTLIIIIWYVTFILLLFVESMEIVRIIKRINRYGIRHGLFTYHVSQWSRNFTFGMFFAFTWKMLQTPSIPLIVWQKELLAFWVWVVICMLCFQTVLFILHHYPRKKVKFK